MYRFSISSTACFYVGIYIGSMPKETKTSTERQARKCPIELFPPSPAPQPNPPHDESPPAAVFVLILPDEPRPPPSPRKEARRIPAHRFPATMVLRNASLSHQRRNPPPHA